MQSKISKRATLDTVKHGKLYALTDPTTGKFAAVKAEVTEEWVEIHPRSVVFVYQGGTLGAGPFYDRYIIEEVEDASLS